MDRRRFPGSSNTGASGGDGRITSSYASLANRPPSPSAGGGRRRNATGRGGRGGGHAVERFTPPPKNSSNNNNDGSGYESGEIDNAPPVASRRDHNRMASHTPVSTTTTNPQPPRDRDTYFDGGRGRGERGREDFGRGRGRSYMGRGNPEGREPAGRGRGAGRFLDSERGGRGRGGRSDYRGRGRGGDSGRAPYGGSGRGRMLSSTPDTINFDGSDQRRPLSPMSSSRGGDDDDRSRDRPFPPREPQRPGRFSAGQPPTEDRYGKRRRDDPHPPTDFDEKRGRPAEYPDRHPARMDTPQRMNLGDDGGRSFSRDIRGEERHSNFPNPRGRLSPPVAEERRPMRGPSDNDRMGGPSRRIIDRAPPSRPLRDEGGLPRRDERVLQHASREEHRPMPMRDDHGPPPLRRDHGAPPLRGERGALPMRDDRGLLSPRDDRGPLLREDHRPPNGSDRVPPQRRDDRGPPPLRNDRELPMNEDHGAPSRSDFGAPSRNDFGPRLMRDDRGPTPVREDRGPPSLRIDRGPRDDRGPPPVRDGRGPPPMREKRALSFMRGDRGQPLIEERGPRQFLDEVGPPRDERPPQRRGDREPMPMRDDRGMSMRDDRNLPPMRDLGPQMRDHRDDRPPIRENRGPPVRSELGPSPIRSDIQPRGRGLPHDELRGAERSFRDGGGRSRSQYPDKEPPIQRDLRPPMEYDRRPESFPSGVVRREGQTGLGHHDSRPSVEMHSGPPRNVPAHFDGPRSHPPEHMPGGSSVVGSRGSWNGEGLLGRASSDQSLAGPRHAIGIHSNDGPEIASPSFMDRDGGGRGGRGFFRDGRGRGRGRSDFGRFSGRGSSDTLHPMEHDGSGGKQGPPPNSFRGIDEGWKHRDSAPDRAHHDVPVSNWGVSRKPLPSQIPDKFGTSSSVSRSQKAMESTTSQQANAPTPIEDRTPSPPPGPRPISPPPKREASGVTKALIRLADLEAQMEYAYAKHMQLVQRQEELRAQTAVLKDVPVGIEAFKEELDALASSGELDDEVAEGN